MQLENIIAEIRVKHRRCCHAMESRKILDLRMGALLRTELGWHRDLPAAERKRIAKEAAVLMKDEKAHLASRLPYKKLEAHAKRDRAKLASGLPVWEAFGKSIRGFGADSFAVIVAEAGDLSDYATEAKLWKRMGLAVVDGARQSSVPESFKGEARKSAWKERGYSPQRRSRMWNIGDTLIKGNRDGKYRTAYLSRKAYELARNPDMPKIHAHRRAQRYMEKRLLRDLWRAWRRTSEVVAERPCVELSAAASIAAE